MTQYLINRINRFTTNPYALPVLFALALLTRGYVALVGGSGGGRGDDDGMMLDIARNFLNHGSFYMYWDGHGPLYSFEPPGVPFLHVIFLSIFKNFWLAERVFFVLMSSVCFVMFYFLAKRLFSKTSAFLGTLILILYPPQWFWSTRINGHTYSTNMLIITLLFLLLSWEKKSTWLSWFNGILLGTMALMRPEYLPFVFFYALASLLKFRCDKQSIKLASFIFLGWALVIAPWAIRNKIKTGKFVLSSTHYSFNLWLVFSHSYQFGGDVPPTPPELQEKLMKVTHSEKDLVDIWVNEALLFIKNEPEMAAKHLLINFLNFWRPWLNPGSTPVLENAVFFLSWMPIFIFFLLGIRKLNFRDPFWLLMAGIVAYKTIAHLPFYMIVRFREAIFPIFLLLALLPIDRIFQDPKYRSE